MLLKKGKIRLNRLKTSTGCRIAVTLNPNGYAECYFLYYSLEDAFVCIESLHQCKDCKNLFTTTYLHDENGLGYCGSCKINYRVCDLCNTVVSVGKTVLTIEGDCVCDSCLMHNERVFQCEYCSEWRIGGVCDCTTSTDTDYSCVTNSIMSYKEFDDWVFMKKENETSPLYMGWEDEIDFKQRKTVEEFDIDFIDTDTMIVENDSTLNYGFEIKSHPMTLNYFLANKETYIDFYKKCKKEDSCFRSAGTHVHISKNGLVDAQIDNFVEFFNVLMPFLEKTGGRHSNQWCKPNEDWQQDDKYHVVNVQNKTLEVRIFSSRFRFERVEYAMCLTHAVYRFVKFLPELHVYYHKNTLNKLFAEFEQHLAKDKRYTKVYAHFSKWRKKMEEKQCA